MIIEKTGNSLYFHKNIKSLVWFQLYWLMFYGVLRDLVGVPGYVAYVLDLFNIILIAYVIANGKMIKYRNSRVGLWIILSFFLLYGYRANCSRGFSNTLCMGF